MRKRRQSSSPTVSEGSVVAYRFPSNFSFLFKRRTLIVITTLIVVAFAIIVWRIKANTQQVLDEERARLERQNLIPFEKQIRPALDSKQIEFWQNDRRARAVARFKDSYFVATDGGLLELDENGKLLKHYSVLDGLPESDLVSLAAFNAKLFIGTRASGLVSFDGERFESYRWLDRSPQSINSLFADAGRLLVGTMAGGLIEFDGRQFKEIKVGAEHKRLPGIIDIAREGPRLFVGTFADGLWVAEGARWSQFTVADGLPSNRVVGVVADDRNLYVAADYGLAGASFADLAAEPAQRSAVGQLFHSVAVLPSLASIVRCGANILLAKDDGESFAIQLDPDTARLPQLQPLGGGRPDTVAGYRLVVLERQLWALSSDGIRRTALAVDSDAATPALLAAVGQVSAAPSAEQAHTVAAASAKSITTNLISALAVDAQGRLWVGGFRSGIDVLSQDGKNLAHLESDTIREINFLLADKRTQTMLAATSQGLLTFDGALQARGRLSTAEGLLSNSVMQVVLTQPGEVMEGAGYKPEQPRFGAGRQDSGYFAFATGKGLTIGARGRLHSLTTVQGLPSNSLYTVLVQGRSLYAGTLSGLALIQDDRVVRVFKDTNSNLTTNWVTALCQAGSRLFVGTYGGGIFELTASGELVSFVAATGKAVINPSAMWSDGVRLYAGTLDGALMFDLRSQQWTHITAELPARAVLSVTGDERFVYFGTTSGIARIERSYWDQPR